MTKSIECGLPSQAPQIMPQYCEFRKPLSELNGATLDLSKLVAKRFRFLVIDSLLNDQVLEITSFSALPTDGNCFATISYPWQGLTPLVPPSLGQFSIKGAESGGSISVNVLRTCCRAARQYRHRIGPCDLLWIDRLCIKQQDKEDKNWQIRHMFDIYRSCAVCLVLPGGLGRLIDPTERSTWAQRAWTLQEAIAPPIVLVVFEWKFSDYYVSYNGEPVGTIEPFHSGALSLLGLVVAVRKGFWVKLKLRRPGDPGYDVVQEELSRLRGIDCISFSEGSLSKPGSSQFEEFSDHEEDRIEIRFRMQTITGNQAYLLWLTSETSKPNDFGEVNSDKLQVALWKATWIRSSSRPVDMVFSIMGLFGVSLDPSKFHRDDRVGATLALASAALQKGSTAAWLGAYFELDPCPFMSSFPSFPNTSESGGCTIKTAAGLINVEDLVNVMNIILPTRSATLDSQGYLHLKSQASPSFEVRKVQAHLQITYLLRMGHGSSILRIKDTVGIMQSHSAEENGLYRVRSLA
ncbi:uncharacterized protein AKAW2_11608S [Aspergillus luchuensis]|uniref:Uncharacterized protein n=1 Tax=Aspergillus kawachii TaxID=1069201 RepID=A0A7R7ZVG0_ASPKA|nr:uncharacterized protein AKAW2_11608S [Aspergillus luchuensis]BCR94562.1 hypothetical protein AKAW2_11608S [Aspergillus luchuensis]BCS07156.1 hypothetical protein ALUC_11537S [Aspergillus luchuensis]